MIWCTPLNKSADLWFCPAQAESKTLLSYWSGCSSDGAIVTKKGMSGSVMLLTSIYLFLYVDWTIQTLYVDICPTWLLCLTLITFGRFHYPPPFRCVTIPSEGCDSPLDSYPIWETSIPSRMFPEEQPPPDLSLTTCSVAFYATIGFHGHCIFLEGHSVEPLLFFYFLLYKMLGREISQPKAAQSILVVVYGIVRFEELYSSDRR